MKLNNIECSVVKIIEVCFFGNGFTSNFIDKINKNLTECSTK